jgi:hypothetical protein
MVTDKEIMTGLAMAFVVTGTGVRAAVRNASGRIATIKPDGGLTAFRRIAPELVFENRGPASALYRAARGIKQRTEAITTAAIRIERERGR